MHEQLLALLLLPIPSKYILCKWGKNAYIQKMEEFRAIQDSLYNILIGYQPILEKTQQLHAHGA